MISLEPTQAQYQSLFGSNQTSWNIHHEQLFGNLTDSLVIDGDTIVDGNTYKKLLYYTYFGSNPTLQNNIGYLSEDIITGKAWYFSTVDTNKRLIMDLSLTLADSFSVEGSYVQVDSVYYLFGKKYIRFDLFTRPSEKFTMVEGVGTNKGICYNNEGLPQLGAYLLCQHKDNLINYQNTDSQLNSVCNSVITGLTDNNFEKKNLVLYPNPASDFITFYYDSKENGNLFIYNILGKLLEKHQLLSTQKKIKINTSHLLGSYFYFINTKENINYFGKFIIIH